jgi:hypothetical protein
VLKLGICGFEFPRHLVAIAVTIVAEYPDISELGKQVGTNLSGVTDLNLPSREQPLTSAPAESLSGQ